MARKGTEKYSPISHKFIDLMQMILGWREELRGGIPGRLNWAAQQLTCFWPQVRTSSVIISNHCK